MPSHPNRSKSAPPPGATPSAQQIIAAREAAGHTPREAARTIYATETAWRAWEAGERTMHPGLFELYVFKTIGEQK